ncbi:bifunctional methylenetetrahydrofolate dehydrogenase/methenyltetrahydrofolate cyclohydrolase FolD [Neorhizobium huautlense]|uniref:bifunctional methylenetetrahydrofolate dehydrogenase/methenyltetrahydrofolate cyclohydrolase FolD n=1 Tax=Neorhizobium huautlense TaxID=67774 RepID=UPI000CF8D9AB|nr:bifunctional methylenetetrahydrofolate dehydrogenase/methenyltetrahydrofolate cyclohydrolase FolD [Neorhizobium huautlense]
MSACIINGKEVAETVIAAVLEATTLLKRRTGIRPGLAVVVVGDDAASHAYVKAKGTMAKRCGFHSSQFTLHEQTTQDDLEVLVNELAADPAVHGILVQLPLPKHLHTEGIVRRIPPEKDVDGLHVVNAGKIATGDLSTGLIPCTPAGAMLLVRRRHGDDLSGLNAVIIGRSNLFGKPMGLLLLAANATVTIAHSRTKDLKALCRNSDILVVAVGRPEMVKADWIRPGATVIDVGINRVPAMGEGNGPTCLVGDVDYSAASKVAGAITPVPGGVGPMTIAMLMNNTLIAARRTVCG